MRAPRLKHGWVSWPVYLTLWCASRWVRYFVTGRSLSGEDTDNATFLHAATKDYRDRPYEVLTGPVWQRLARRWALAGVPLVLAAVEAAAAGTRAAYRLAGRPAPGWAGVPWGEAARAWLVVAVVVVLALCGRAVALWVRDGRRVRDFVYPTWEAAANSMGVAYHRRDARRMVQLPDGFVPPDALEEDPNFAVRWYVDLVERRRLRREVASVEAAAEVEGRGGEVVLPGDTDEEVPGAEVVRSARAVVARFRGRLLDREATVPGHHELSLPPVRIGLYPGRVSTPAAKRAFLAAVTGPLGMPDAHAEWFLRGRKPYVDLRPNLLPPELVTFDSVRKHFAAAAVGQPIIGMAAGGRPVHIDFENNSPHVMISGGSGTGKSVLGKAILCQRMHHGAGVIMLDYKRVSHRWLHNLPGCIYAWRLADIHDVLVKAGEELDRRLEEVLPPDNDIDAVMQVFPLIDVVVEEINSTTMLLQDYWKEHGDGGQSPAISALKRCVNMGREYRMHVYVLAQRASAGVFGGNGGDIRESFQTRLMAKWTVPTWKMLAGGAEYRRPLGGRGIWARVQDDEVEIVRTPMGTDRDARAWATSGTPCPATPDVLPGRTDAVRVASTRVPDAGPELVTLSAALSQLPADARGRTLAIEGLRTASRRDGFPVPVRAGAPGRAALYDLDALVSWRLGQGGGEVGYDPVAEAVAALDPDRRPGRVYAFDTLDPDTGDVVVGYVGKTVRELVEREREHRGDKPWDDLIVGRIRELWAGDPTPGELDALEQRYIRDLKPLYNVEFQKGAAWAIPLAQQIAQRHARDRAAGRPLWAPRDVYHGGGRPSGGYGEYVADLADESARAFDKE